MTHDEMLKLCEEAERLVGAATDGPWVALDYVTIPSGEKGVCSESAELFVVPPGSCATQDAEFIAASRTLVPRLAAALREMVEREMELSNRTITQILASRKFTRPEDAEEPPCPADPPRE